MAWEDELVEPRGFGSAGVNAGELICRSLLTSPWSIMDGHHTVPPGSIYSCPSERENNYCVTFASFICHPALAFLA